MSHRLELGLALALALAVSVAVAAGRRGSERPEFDLLPSTLLSGPLGSRALYDVLARLRVPVARRHTPLFDFARDTAGGRGGRGGRGGGGGGGPAGRRGVDPPRPPSPAAGPSRGRPSDARCRRGVLPQPGVALDRCPLLHHAARPAGPPGQGGVGRIPPGVRPRRLDHGRAARLAHRHAGRVGDAPGRRGARRRARRRRATVRPGSPLRGHPPSLAARAPRGARRRARRRGRRRYGGPAPPRPAAPPAPPPPAPAPPPPT